jgi:hypothetical protein
MAEATAPKPSSSVKLVLLGEAAVGKVNAIRFYAQGLYADSHIVVSRLALRE